jgi:hypothetical protein
VTPRKTAYGDLVLLETAGRDRFALLKFRGRTVLVVRGAKQTAKLKIALAILRNRAVDPSLLTDHFFSVLSLYFCEEQSENYRLLFMELSKLKPGAPERGPGRPRQGKGSTA